MGHLQVNLAGIAIAVATNGRYVKSSRPNVVYELVAQHTWAQRPGSDEAGARASTASLRTDDGKVAVAE